MADGKDLNDAELEYVKIFANLKDMEKAQNKAELKSSFSDDFVKDLEGMGISRDDIEGMRVRIGSNGTFSVADSGFAVDMGALDGRFTPQSSGNMYSGMYKYQKYQFKKVL